MPDRRWAMAKVGSFAKVLRRVKRYWFCYAMMSGTFALIITFSYYPMASTFYHGFTIWDGFRPERWVGMANYRELFSSDSVFYRSLCNIAALATWHVFRAASFPLLGAALIYRIRSERTAYVFRLLFVLPIVVPSVVSILVWRRLYDPNVGLFNEILAVVGLRPLAWLNSPKTALASLMFMGFPWIDGVGLLVYLAGLLAIPGEVIEPAIVDGASGWRRFWSIELPLVVPQIRLIVILDVIWSLQSFGWQLLVTGGGPDYATTVPAWQMYQAAMTAGRFGIASAIGTLLFVLIFALTLVNNATIRSATEYQAN